MASPFASIEARINDAVIAHLSNATAVSGAVSWPVLFDMPDQRIFNDMQISTEYSITYKSSYFPGLKRGDGISINSIAYTVREVSHPGDDVLMHATLSK